MAKKSTTSAQEQVSGKKILVIAEKPSVAGDFVKALEPVEGKFRKDAKYWESEHYVVSYAIGHLVTLADPAEIDERYKGWKIDTLPIIPDQFVLKPIEESRPQLSALNKLCRRRDVELIVNACDAGREGELIFRYIMDYLGHDKKIARPTKRLWLQSMTPSAIRDAFAKLRPSEEMADLAAAAVCRSEADWLIGINGSRGLTAWNSRHGGFFLTPCGRVQTPSLALIVDRENERKSFVPKDYWIVEAQFDCGGSRYMGRWFDPSFRRDGEDDERKSTRIWDEKSARAIVAKTEGKTGTVSETSKSTSQGCQPLYDLTALQREANNRFGFSAKTTLSIAQALYEKKKALTYPRTDSRHLPEDYVPTVYKVLKSMQSGPFGKFAAEAVEKKYVHQDKRIFNNAKISDHHAIIPTELQAKGLTEAEQKIYDMVCQRTIAVFFPPAEYSVTSRVTVVEGESFKTDGKILVVPGWKAVYGKSEDPDSIKPLSGDRAELLSADVLGDSTKPPARYTEASLLSAMEGAGKLVDDEELAEALKDRGLGTPATRAAIIEKLISDRYVVRDGRDLVPTRKAFDLLGLIGAMKIDYLGSAELTGEWEQKLKQIERGELSRDEFMKDIRSSTEEIVERIRGFDEERTRKEASFSPVNGEKIYECVGHYEKEDGSCRVRKIIGGRHFSAAEIAELYAAGQVGPFHDFRSKRNTPFSAAIQLKDGRTEFLFSQSSTDSKLDTSSLEPLGNSPVDGSPVYEDIQAYVSQSHLDGSPKGLRINRVILGKQLSPDDVRALLSKGRTGLIQGFRSNRTHKTFDATLVLNKDGKIGFEFPPRKSGFRRGAKKAAES